ncbi:putative GNAT family N-acetyltransferase [Colletotrichum karsti]|uniref:GNAT family N-acetyltransferase n=1 Tax=Colletotrichum karsti TaxID=1095194 RepID=A0A9P6LM36_9PEZI|nr:putative GNAT family N-acetyltransferase [Colletotrichum karsti]KAF9878428.1 putative GNAT family N-acetyltransferase [Colletotrichum karsti]
MASTASQLRNKKWTRDSYLISTDISLIPLHDLNAAFASPEFYWAKSLPPSLMEETLQNSLCFGLYDLKNHTLEAAEDLLRQNSSSSSTTTDENSSLPKLIGFARVITDFITFAFITDVWVHPSTTGKGLGTWLVGRVQEVLEGMEHLRRSMLLTSSWDKSVPFYEKLMRMELMNERKGEGTIAVMQMKWKGQVDWVEPEP